MKDLGKPSPKPMPVEISPRPTKWYPSTTVDAKQFPQLAKAKIGKDMEVVMRIRKTGERISPGSHSIDFELRAVELDEEPKSIEDARQKLMKESE